MEINYFDITVSIIVLFLGLKGILNGFFKEVFGLIGIIGGIFVASRVGNDVGQYLSDLIFHFENSSAVNFTGFISTLAIFWLIMIGIGHMFKRLSSLSGLGIFDQILGFAFGASKFFLIAAVIAHASYNIQALRSAIDDTSLKNSMLFPVLVHTGSYIMKLDPVEIGEDINQTTKELRESANKVVDDSAKHISENVIKQIKETMPDITKDIASGSDK